MKFQLFSFFCVVFIVSCVRCANILAIFNIPSKSHTILGVKLAEGLIIRGHHVTLASPYDIDPTENLTHIHLKTLKEYKDKMEKTMTKPVSPLQSFLHIMEFMKVLTDLLWQEPAMKKIISEKPKYDALIMGSFYSDALFGLSHHLRIPTILFSCIGANILTNSFLANPNMVYVPHTFIGSPTDTFFGRLYSTTANILTSFVTDMMMDPYQQGILDKYFPNAPPLRDLKRNASLMLLNSHFSIESPRPYVPNMIQVGGFHLQDSKKLPAEIKNYLDTAENGAILFSFGSNVLISSIEENVEAVLKVLGEMAPMKVIFKSELDHKNVPKNIIVKSWLPQAEILGHPNLKVFISHGGLGGTTEAVYHGVPILGIPFFGDQKMNLQEAETAGYAIALPYQEFNEEIFRTKLKEIRNNPKYKENAKKRSALMKGQPVKPMDNAVFWIEHIIKFGGGDHLRNAGMDLTWYQLYMVDIYVFYTVLLCLMCILSYYMLKFSLKLVKRVILVLKK
ncbi:hypothetical protein HHI36_010881 [Cryptolaemus montrouzieri]|uniref:UDP-glucuronosyltransferase n=1 Tax=Cryptolaemus montrouzieri TaxID=559131 RepID=A0ABD2MK60_9CUCU